MKSIFETWAAIVWLLLRLEVNELSSVITSRQRRLPLKVSENCHFNSIVMRPSSLGGGRILRRTLSVRLSVCLSVRPSRYRCHWLRLFGPGSVTSRHLANYNDTHVLFGTHWGPHIVRPSRPHKFLFDTKTIRLFAVRMSTALYGWFTSRDTSRRPVEIRSGTRRQMPPRSSSFRLFWSGDSQENH